MVGLGFDLKQDFWVYFTPNHGIMDLNSALEHGDMVLRNAETVASEDESRKTQGQRKAKLTGRRRSSAGDNRESRAGVI